MAIAHPTMHQVAPHTWTFEPAAVSVAPMKAHCRVCRQPVGILNPAAMSLQTGNYVVRGACEVCGSEVVLIVS
jgi:rRNA maturation protein Nop10